MTSIGFESQMTTAKKHTAFNRALTPSAELAAELRAAGFRKVREREPQFHKKGRDMRLEARA